MAEFDVWFCRYEDKTFCATAAPGEPPTSPVRIPNVGFALRKIRFAGNKIVTIGIVSPEMLGLEVEV